MLEELKRDLSETRNLLKLAYKKIDDLTKKNKEVKRNHNVNPKTRNLLENMSPRTMKDNLRSIKKRQASTFDASEANLGINNHHSIIIQVSIV